MDCIVVLQRNLYKQCGQKPREFPMGELGIAQSVTKNSTAGC